MALRPTRVEPCHSPVGQQAEIDHRSTWADGALGAPARFGHPSRLVPPITYSFICSRSRSSAANSKFSVSIASRSCSRRSASWLDAT